jgi:uncharacterized membrane protein
LEILFKLWTNYLARGTEGAAAIVIGLAIVRATFQALRLFVHPSGQQATEDVRLQLGRWLAVALEFELAADILGTAIAPTWNEIGKLAAIVVLRTVLNYFLQQEIDRAAVRNSSAGQAAPLSGITGAPVNGDSTARADGHAVR